MLDRDHQMVVPLTERCGGYLRVAAAQAHRRVRPQGQIDDRARCPSGYRAQINLTLGKEHVEILWACLAVVRDGTKK